MVANKNKLKGKIVENGFTQQTFSKALGLTATTLKAKMESAKAEFKLGESIKVKELLNLSAEEYLEIFIYFN